MSLVADLTVQRLQQEEAFRADVYDDSNGLPLICHGEPTIGYGCRCRQWSKGLALAVLAYQVAEVESTLTQFPWYARITDSARASAILDAAFNLGVSGLVNGFPHFVAAVATDDWVRAASELHVKDSKQDNGRYAALRELIAVGAAD